MDAHNDVEEHGSCKKVDVYLPLMVMHMPYRRRYVSLSHEGYSVICVRLVL